MRTTRARLNGRLQAILSEVVQALKSALSEELRQVVLYGSYARGSATPDSDVDLLVIVCSATPTLEDTVSRTVYDVMWTHEFRFLLSVLVLSEEQYGRISSRGYSFARNVQREGVVLWPRAA